jgi:hypothetical protein
MSPVPFAEERQVSAVLNFVFSTFWVWIGTTVLLTVIARGVIQAAIVVVAVVRKAGRR